MELHERLVTTKPRRRRGSTEGAVRRPQELDPHARHQRARPPADGPALDPVGMRERVLANIRRHLSGETGISREDRERLTTRSRTTSSATARSSASWPTTPSRRSWSTGRARSGSSARAACTRPPCASATTRTCAGSSTGWWPRSVAGSTSRRRWSTRAFPTESRVNAIIASPLALGAAPHDPKVLEEAPRARTTWSTSAR